MATQPHHDDDPAKKPDDADKSPKTPRPEKPPVPNMELDEPEAPLFVDEVIEEEAIPVLEAAEEGPLVIADEDVFAAEVVDEAAPVSDVMVADEVEEVVEAAPASEVVLADEALLPRPADSPPVVAQPPTSVQAAAPAMAMDALSAAAAHVPPPAPKSDVDLMQMFGEQAIVAPAAAEPPPAPAPAVAAEPEVDLQDLFADEPTIHAAEPVAEVHVEPAPPEIVAAEASPLSDIFAAEEVVEEAPVAAEKVVEEAAPASDVFAAEEVVEEAAPASDVFAAEEVVEEAAPASEVTAAEDVFDTEEYIDSAPVSAPKSAELAAEAVKEPSSATRKAEAVLDDEVSAAEEAEEVLDAEEAEEVLDAEEAEAEEVLDAEEAETVATGSSAVLFDEPAEATSGVQKSNSAAKAAASSSPKRPLPIESQGSGAKKAEEELITEEELLGSAEASAVNLGEMPARKGTSVTGIDKVAEALESGIDLEHESAEPLEASEASVVFDEALEELGDSAEGAIDLPKGKKFAARDDEGSTDMDQEALENLGAIEEQAASKKKKKKSAPASDEVDLESLFDDNDAESAQPIDEVSKYDATVAFDTTSTGDSLKGSSAEVAEPAEEDEAAIFDEEIEPAEALADDEVDLGAGPEDAEPKAKKTKGRKPLADEDEDAAEAIEEEDEAPEKKGKKELAAVAPPEKRPSMALRWLGGMFIGMFLLVAAAGAGWYFAPDDVASLVKSSPNATPEKKGPPPIVKTKAEQAHGLMDQGKYKDALALLEATADPTDLAARGEARWLDYYQRQTDAKAPLDKDAPEVKKAKEELKGKDLLVAQIDAAINLKAKEKEAEELTAKLQMAADAKKKTDEELMKVTLDKQKAEKETDAVAKAVADAKLIEDKSKFDVATLQKILKDLGEEKATLESVNKLLKDAEVKDAGDKGVKSILEAKKDADDKLTAINKVLEDEKIKEPGAKGVLSIVDARNKTAKDRDELLANISAAVKEFVDGKIVPADGDPRKQLVEGAKLARLKSESPLAIPLAQLGMQLASIGAGTGKLVEKSFDIAKLAAELSFYKTREPLIQTPQMKMDTDIALLQDRSQNNPKELAAITREADWVLAPESKSSPDARAKARYVHGLALRNLGQYPQARAAFDDALKLATGPWAESVKNSKAELTDPAIYYIPRIEKQGIEKQFKSAYAEANTAIKVMPDEARLYALRALIHLELIRGQGAKAAADDQKAIRADAANAAKDAKLTAESAYIVGLLEEELGNWSEAEKQFRQALKAHQGPADEAGRYRIALARLLLRDRPEAPAPVAPPASVEDEEEAAAPSPAERTIVMHPLSLLVVSAVIAQPGDDEEDPAMVARLKETIDLANQLIASKTDKIKGQGYLILGSALSRQGKRTEGLKEYTKGLKLVYPGIESDELAKLVAEHPAFQQPDAGGNDPILAERHFGEGYHLYWAKKYPEAEAQFKKAVALFDKDARYQYFLGLAQYQQKTKAKRDAAYFSWEQGARLETKAATNPFAVREINAALERVQGNERQLLNSYRYKAAEEAEAK